MIPIRATPELTTDLSKYIFIKENYLDKNICDELVSYGKQNRHADINYTKWNHKFDVSNLPLDYNIHSFLNNVWEEAILFFGTRIDFIEPYSLKGYNFGSFFGEHIDNYICVTDKIDRKLTLIVQLSEDNDYTAGNVSVVGKILPRTIGSLIIFPSNFKHHVSKVGRGERWSLISWAWGPAF
jgi:predicted 2-oxoglutarate/Fe(II)-dependent dioxygenase YbiX